MKPCKTLGPLSTFGPGASVALVHSSTAVADIWRCDSQSSVSQIATALARRSFAAYRSRYSFCSQQRYKGPRGIAKGFKDISRREMLRDFRSLLGPLRAEVHQASFAFGHTSQRGLLDPQSKYPACLDNAYYSTKVRHSLFDLSKERWIARFGSCKSLPECAILRGTYCPVFHSSFHLDTNTALAIAGNFYPRVSEANDFMSPTTEAALCLTVYEVLKTFGKIGKGLMLEATTVEEALDHDIDAQPQGLSLPELVVKQQGTGQTLLVVKVKRSLMGKAAVWHMLSELAIAARHNQGIAIGALSNIHTWVFFQVTALQGGEGLDVKMSEQQRLEMNPIYISDSTVKVIEFMCQALFPGRSSLSQTDVMQALAAMDSRSHRLMQQAFNKYLSEAEFSYQIPDFEVEYLIAEKNRLLAEKNRLLTELARK